MAKARIESELDISNACFQPFRAYHFFHEQLNVYVKVSFAAAVLLVRETAREDRPKELGALIRLAHPSWKNPSVTSMSLHAQREFETSISSFALVSAFSAFDDFLAGTEADIAALRAWNPRFRSTKHIDRNGAGENEERFVRFFLGQNWKLHSIEHLLPLVRYFRLARNCIAHRSGKASAALASSSEELRSYTGRKIDPLPVFDHEDQIRLPVKDVILCSHILRELAQGTNKLMLSDFGLDGLLYLAAKSTFIDEPAVLAGAHKTPERAINSVLLDRYGVIVLNRNATIRELKRIDLWADCRDRFKKYHDNPTDSFELPGASRASRGTLLDH